MTTDQFTTQTGYAIKDISREARQVFRSLLGQENAEPDARQDEQWTEFAELALEPFIEQITTQFSGLTRRAVAVFHSVEEYEELPAAMRFAFEAACRHIICLAQAQDSDDLASVQEFNWKTWLARRLSSPLPDEPLQDDEDEDNEEIKPHDDEDEDND